MSFNDIIMFVMAVGILLGAGDKIIGNKFGLGKQFDDGFHTLGPIGLSIVGIIVLVPVIAEVLGPVILPVYRFFSIDPAMFATILANDLGGYSLAVKLAQNEQLGVYAGTTIASMIGCTIVFSIPVGISLIQKEDYPYFFKGVMIGLIAIPVGSLAGGLSCGIPFKLLFVNCLPIIFLAILLVFGLIYAQSACTKAFAIFGRAIAAVSTIGLAASAFQSLTGIELIKGIAPITDGTKVLINTGIVLLGSYPIIYLVQKILARPFTKMGARFRMNTDSMMGFLVTMTNSVPVFTMIKKMNPRGKVINMAWLVCAAASFGAHLGFTAGVEPEMITALLIGKLTAGTCAVLIALIVTRDMKEDLC